MLRLVAIIVLGFTLPLAGVAEEKPNGVDRAFSRLYNFDFAGTHAALNQYISANPADPLGYAVRASAYLFHELDRLSILESEFFSDDKRIVEKKKLRPDPLIKAQLFKAIEDAQSRAQARLTANPNEQDSLFVMCITTGVLTDYTALIEKKQIGSLSLVKKSTAYAQRLLQLNPKYYDAYLTTGMAEYLIGSLPFFVRWFVKVDNVGASKEKGMQTVELVAQKGHYLKPFAKILLAVANLREKKPRASQQILAGLARDYPENPLFKKELSQLTLKLRSAKAGDQ